ncbi:MAG TPA: aminotransferase class V-fold PLP-dependent enzyme, partial [Nitrolancea sp.]|nr:aminotransferase class V-fold PLP-dependent enzyme [Nitrolancea sp.]
MSSPSQIPTGQIDVDRLKQDFPILSRPTHGKRLVYLDSAASSQKPAVVIDALANFYRTTNANIHRGV